MLSDSGALFNSRVNPTKRIVEHRLKAISKGYVRVGVSIDRKQDKTFKQSLEILLFIECAHQIAIHVHTQVAMLHKNIMTS